MHTRQICAAVCLALVGAGVATAGESAATKRLTLTTQSQEAKDLLAQLQRQIENLQFGTANVELAKKIVAIDPGFAMGTYYLSAVTPPPENQKHLEKAVELAQNASQGERRFIEALVIARSPEAGKAIAPLTQLAKEYPDERVIHAILGQVLSGEGKVPEARSAYQKAIALDPKTPRAYSFLGNLLILEGQYAKAREAYAGALKRLPQGGQPGAIRYNVAFSYLYDGQPDKALGELSTFVGEYEKAGAPFGIPEVFIWNSIARINLENGRLDEAMKAYEKGYESVPGSSLEEDDKKIWLGRLRHGKGRTLARMGKFEDAWKEAETVRQMITDAGERGKEFEPAYQYLAGYIKLVQGDSAAAIEHLKQSKPDEDPFRGLLLARAYEKSGDKANAKKSYEAVVRFSGNNIERALAYPEAKKKLASL
jgi:tetratricopeptide (TPR) repeat protein